MHFLTIVSEKRVFVVVLGKIAGSVFAGEIVHYLGVIMVIDNSVRGYVVDRCACERGYVVDNASCHSVL